MGLKLVFTEEQLRQLRSSQRPRLDEQGRPVLTRGRVMLEPNADGNAWRDGDALKRLHGRYLVRPFSTRYHSTLVPSAED